MNYTLNTRNTILEQDVREYVYAAKEDAKHDGCFTTANVNELKHKIATRMNLDEDEVLITADSVPKYRVNEFNENELIHYRVEVPVKQVIAGNRLFNISDAENKKNIVIENDVASERLAP
jgi:hypothetical protein